MLREKSVEYAQANHHGCSRKYFASEKITPIFIDRVLVNHKRRIEVVPDSIEPRAYDDGFSKESIDQAQPEMIL